MICYKTIKSKKRFRDNCFLLNPTNIRYGNESKIENFACIHLPFCHQFTMCKMECNSFVRNHNHLMNYWKNKRRCLTSKTGDFLADNNSHKIKLIKNDIPLIKSSKKYIWKTPKASIVPKDETKNQYPKRIKLKEIISGSSLCEKKNSCLKNLSLILPNIN